MLKKAFAFKPINFDTNMLEKSGIYFYVTVSIVILLNETLLNAHILQ